MYLRKKLKGLSANSGLSQVGFQANFKVGFVLGSWFLNRYIWLTKSPTDAKPRDVSGHAVGADTKTEKFKDLVEKNLNIK